MTLSLEVNNTAWTSHIKNILNSYASPTSEVTPVIKGNGYGISRKNLATKAHELGITSVAVGTIFEAQDVLGQGFKEVLVMDPVKDIDELAFKELTRMHNSSLLLTISCLKDAQNVGNNPVVVEGITSMNRFGIGINNLAEVSNLNLKGISLHFPTGNTKIGKTTEVANWLNSYKTLCPIGRKLFT